MPYTPPIGDDILLEAYDTEPSEPPVGDNISLEINEGDIKGYFVAFDGTSQSGGYVEASTEVFSGQVTCGGFCEADLVPLDGDLFANSPRVIQFINGTPWVQQNLINYEIIQNPAYVSVGGNSNKGIQKSAFAVVRDRVYALGGDHESPYFSDAVLYYTDADKLTWLSGPTLPTATWYGNALIAKDRLFFLGFEGEAGFNGKVYSIAVDEYGLTGTWEEETTYPIANIRYNSSIIIKNRLYSFCGYNGSTTQASVYYNVIREDRTLGAWIQDSDFPIATSGLELSIYKGRLYAFSSSSIYFATINEDGSLSSWTHNTIDIPLYYGGFKLYTNSGKIFIFYHTGANYSANVDSATGQITSWTSRNAFQSSSPSRTGFGIIAYDQFLYIIGGYNSTADVNYINSIQIALSASFAHCGITDGVPYSYIDTNQGTVYASFERLDGGLFQGGILYGDFEPWDGEFIPELIPHVFAEFQLWNGTFWCNLMSISGSFSTWYGELSGVYAYNLLNADFPKFTADIYSGGSLESAFEGFSDTDIYGTVGQSIGILTYFARWDGLLFAGGKSVEPYPEVSMFTAEITGHVTHINRIQADLPLFTMTGAGYISGSGQINARFEQLSSIIEGRVMNPATITGDLPFFSMTGRAHKMQQTEVLGQLIPFSGQISAKDTTPGNITADFELWDANLRRSFMCVKEAAITSQDVKFNGGLGL